MTLRAIITGIMFGGLGLWCILSAIGMKVTGTLSSLIASPEEAKKCNQPQKVIRQAFLVFLPLGILMLAMGIVLLVGEYMELWEKHSGMFFGILGAALVLCLGFMLYVQRVRKSYFKL